MKRVMALLLLLTCPGFAADLITLDGKTYRNFTVSRVESDGLAITHAEGAGKVEFLNLPQEVRKRYGFDPAKAEAAKKAAATGWQEMDQRLVFFTIQLSSVETSLAAINRAVGLLGNQQAVHKLDATKARQANEAMDRNAGGPVPWTEFYGRTAEKFFYHPTDRNSSYHTLTVLKQESPAWDNASGQGVPSRQGLPVHQRPPQFDYIYRANNNAEQRAQEEVARLGNNAAALLARRAQLEAEQSALWCKIGFHSVAGRELLSKPLYFCDLKNAGTDSAETRQKLEALRAALDFLRNGNKLAAMVEQGVDAAAARCYSQLQAGVEAARAELQRRLMQQAAVAGDIGDSHTLLGRFAAVAKRMSEVSANITDAYRLALDGDKAGDQGRKLTFRSQLQQSLMLCAEALLAGDECVTDLAREWKVQPATQTTAPASTTVQPQLAAPALRAVETPKATAEPMVTLGGAEITLSCSEEVHILPLESGQMRMFNSDPDVVRNEKIGDVNPGLSGWQFTSIKKKGGVRSFSYELRVNQGGYLYAFGFKQKTAAVFPDARELDNWEDVSGMIRGLNIGFCFRRKVSAGEIVKVRGNHLQMAAKSIELMRDGKAESATQPTPPVPATAQASLANMGGAAITIACSEEVRIVSLEARQPIWHSAPKMPPPHFGSISPELSGWQFTSIAWHSINAYEVRVNQDGVLYAFGGGNDRRKVRDFLGTEDIGKWADVEGAITGPPVHRCIRRAVTAGEIIKLKGLELQLAAKSIELVRDGKAESATQPAAPAPASAVVVPVAVSTLVAKTEGAVIAISCSDALRVLPLVAGGPTFYNSPKSPPELIQNVSPEFSGWQYVSPPMGAGDWYEVRVKQDGFLYVFGCRNKDPDRDGGEKITAWEDATGALNASGLNFSRRRKVTAGEIIKLKAFHVLLAAKSIELAHDGKAEPTTQPVAPR